MGSIFVLPTIEGLPPRAMLGEVIATAEDTEGEEEVQALAMMGVLATWSHDMGTWTVEGMPVPQELADRITEHAKDLGVEW